MPCARVLRIRLLQLRAAELEAIGQGLSGTDSSVKTFVLHEKQWSFYKTEKNVFASPASQASVLRKERVGSEYKIRVGNGDGRGIYTAAVFLQKKKPKKTNSAFAGIVLQLGSNAGQEKKGFTESTNHLQVICYPSTLPYELKSDTN